MRFSRKRDLRAHIAAGVPASPCRGACSRRNRFYAKHLRSFKQLAPNPLNDAKMLPAGNTFSRTVAEILLSDAGIHQTSATLPRRRRRRLRSMQAYSPARRRHSDSIAVVATVIGCVFGTSGFADTWTDTHDEPQVAWSVDTSTGARVLSHARVRAAGDETGRDHGAERITYAAAPGTTAWAWRPTPPAAVIDELAIGLVATHSAPGALIAAEVVLPRTEDDGQNVRLLLRSPPSQAAPNKSHKLELRNIPLMLSRAARIWRVGNRGKEIDTRGAYVSRVALAMPGTGGAAKCEVHELWISTLVTPARLVDTAEASPTASASPQERFGGSIRGTVVTLRSDGFRIDGELFFPRVWRSRGEPMQFLAERGVNTVWLERPPTPQDLANAAHNRLRIICPPPDTADTAAWDCVLAWAIPGEQDSRTLDAGLVEVARTKRMGPRNDRPVLAHVTDSAGAWSRVVDGLLIDAPRGTRLGDAGSADNSLQGVPPGTPVLSVVRLDADPRVVQQLDALLGEGVTMPWLPPADLATAADAAIRSKAVGLAFRADERLDEPDDATRAAAGWIEAMNRRLRLIEPWLSGPRSSHPIESHPGATLANRAGVRLALAPMIQSADSEESATLLLPGVDETAGVYRLTPSGVTPWPSDRVVGGVGAKLGGGTHPGDLLVCNDPRVVRSLRRYTSSAATRSARNLMGVAELALRHTEALTDPERKMATQLLGESRLAAARNDPGDAYDKAYGVLNLVSSGEQRRRALAQDSTDWFESSPLAVLPATLTDHFRMAQLVAASARGPNVLQGGSFEDIDAMRSHGWRHPATDREGDALVELASSDPIHGERTLRLQGDSPTSAVRIVSPAVDLPGRTSFEVTGWARVGATAGGGRLVVEESIGGEGLALAIPDTGGQWRPFRLLRATRDETSISVSIGVSGVAEAEVDGVMIRTIEPLGVARRSTAQPK